MISLTLPTSSKPTPHSSHRHSPASPSLTRPKHAPSSRLGASLKSQSTSNSPSPSPSAWAKAPPQFPSATTTTKHSSSPTPPCRHSPSAQGSGRTTSRAQTTLRRPLPSSPLAIAASKRRATEGGAAKGGAAKRGARRGGGRVLWKRHDEVEEGWEVTSNGCCDFLIETEGVYVFKT